jgi:hypothetical protein
MSHLNLRTDLPHHNSTMSISDSAQRCNELRIDLKAWEKKFAAANQGRKAGRSDIKAEETIGTRIEYTRHFTTALTNL